MLDDMPFIFAGRKTKNTGGFYSEHQVKADLQPLLGILESMHLRMTSRYYPYALGTCCADDKTEVEAMRSVGGGGKGMMRCRQTRE